MRSILKLCTLFFFYYFFSFFFSLSLCLCLCLCLSVCLCLLVSVCDHSACGLRALGTLCMHYCYYTVSVIFLASTTNSLDTRAAGLATLINRMNKSEMTIAVDGSLYRFHPRFHNLMCLKIQELVKPGLKVRDSSIIIIITIAVTK